MPMVYNAICARFPGVDVRRVDPEHAIAYGAARYAATLSWDELHQETHKETQMIDLIASHGYGIRYLVPDGRGGRMNRVVILIPRGSRLPASCQLRSFAREGEDFTILRVYETDRDCGLREQIPLEECRQVLETSIHMDRPLAGRAESQDTLSLTEDGILTVSSVNLTTKQSAQNQVQLTHIL